MRLRRLFWIGIATLLVGVYLAGCRINTRYPEEASAGRELYQPVIEALEAYKADHESYPTSLRELIPDYLDEIPDGTVIHPEFEGPFYSDADGTYTIRFTTHMFGAHCTYSPEDGWHCGDLRG
jgi:hypothetical protein